MVRTYQSKGCIGFDKSKPNSSANRALNNRTWGDSVVFKREADNSFAYFSKMKLKSVKKDTSDNALKFIYSQLAKFGLVLSKNISLPKLVLY